MKRLLFLTLIIFHCSIIVVRAQELVRQVVASTGYSETVGYTIFQYTIGEAMVSTLQAGDLLLTQGFQQPEVVLSAPNEDNHFVSDFMVYPNPASNVANLEFDLLQGGRVVFQLVNNAGQVVFSTTVNMLAGRITYTIPVSMYASGLYYIVVNAGYRRYTEKLIIQ
ncbi:T9SS type A sorting domain-containing protein [Parapedobacter tibetensis]|uniref:T9SS type A sorting domain-containing protein n=1 Tax=Parapedobacter tibetensis TaxID=2972951 RepID=UPI00214D2E87|nr:T9SS type A sorting domain-containing protein [Parapedobacter tibetensis]